MLRGSTQTVSFRPRVGFAALRRRGMGDALPGGGAGWNIGPATQGYSFAFNPTTGATAWVSADGSVSNLITPAPDPPGTLPLNPTWQELAAGGAGEASAPQSYYQAYVAAYPGAASGSTPAASSGAASGPAQPTSSTSLPTSSASASAGSGQSTETTSVFGYPVPTSFLTQDVSLFGYSIPVWGLGLGVIGILAFWGFRRN